MERYTGGLVSIDRQPQRAALRSFGVALALLCIGHGVWSWTNNQNHTGVVISSVGLVLAGLARLRPSALRRPYVLLQLLSYPVRLTLSFLVLAMVYFALITPIAWGVRAARRLSARELTPHSHWRECPPRSDKPSYFRQF